MENEYNITDEQIVRRANEAVRIELEKNKAMDIPVYVYDSDTQKVYQINSDGTKLPAGDRLRKGRYSERIKKEA